MATGMQRQAAMAATIDYYFTHISPFTYFGHRALVDVASKHGAQIAYKPFNLFDVFKSSGAVPVPQRPPSRQAYRLIELQRIAEFRGLPVKVHPAHWPTDPNLANGCVVALVERGTDPGPFVFSALSACWAEDKNIAEAETLADLLKACGHVPEGILERAASDDVLATLARNTEDAVALGALGSPTYALNGEVFWGQDRIDYLDHALTTGRGPFTAV